MRVERVVFDTNVLISSVLSESGRPAQCIDWVLAHGIMVLSPELWQEFTSRIVRPKFQKYIRLERLNWALSHFPDSALHVQITGDLAVCRDPDDDKVIETALMGQADYLVTGDKDLLVLNPFQGIRILLPHEFLQAVLGASP